MKFHDVCKESFISDHVTWARVTPVYAVRVPLSATARLNTHDPHHENYSAWSGAELACFRQGSSHTGTATASSKRALINRRRHFRVLTLMQGPERRETTRGLCSLGQTFLLFAVHVKCAGCRKRIRWLINLSRSATKGNIYRTPETKVE